MANRLGKLPISTADTRYGVECRYCQITNNGHEKELIAKAKKLCKNHTTNHFLDYVTSELDALDHAKLTKNVEVEILVEIHEKLGCTCLTETTHTIEDLTRSTEHVTIPSAYAPITNSNSRNTPPKTTPKTLLERLKNGQNGQHKTG